ncbi:MAG TPA: 30S ribosomal protein S12 methylthiotransferase RimO [Candidatus Polarisedimenticolia bacterium]|nr:30S ribosomal protein S12 methylthiotransferase RimO [Candidatus Polarisedimenticolia bacterium]
MIAPLKLTKPQKLGVSARVALVTLGCAKNLVDSEIMAGLLTRGGFTTASDPSDADVALVNTCAFIGPSQKESIDRILEMAALKREGKLRAVVVAGCLAQRYQAELLAEIPEVDAVVGTGQVDAIVRVLNRALREDHERILEVGPPGTAVDLAGHRAVSTPRHVAYLRIADGCDFRCTFCIIPQLRGDLRSRPLESVVAEARRLAEAGTKELLLIAQDSTSYGADLYGEARLPQLLRALATVDGIEWIRVHYTHPKTWSEALIQVFEEESKVCKYVDIPLQHVTDAMLRRMRREVRRADTERLIETLRARVPGVAIRTHFIVGFPGETEEDFDHLLRYVREAALDHVGCFAYSREEGTPGGRMKEQLPERVKLQRRRALMAAQREVAAKVWGGWVGRTVPVRVDAAVPGRPEVWSGRVEQQGYEVDGVTYVRGAVKPGERVTARIVRARQYDLDGEVVA